MGANGPPLGRELRRGGIRGVSSGATPGRGLPRKVQLPTKVTERHQHVTVPSRRRDERAQALDMTAWHERDSWSIAVHLGVTGRDYRGRAAAEVS